MIDFSSLNLNPYMVKDFQYHPVYHEYGLIFLQNNSLFVAEIMSGKLVGSENLENLKEYGLNSQGLYFLNTDNLPTFLRIKI